MGSSEIGVQATSEPAPPPAGAPRGSRVRARILAGMAGVVLVGFVAGLWYLRPIAPIATGYAAKITCSGHFVSGRDADAVWQDVPSNPLIPLLRRDVDADRGSVTVTLLGAWSSTAWFTPGRGCTLAAERPDVLPADPMTPNAATTVWPDGAAVDPHVAARAAGLDPGRLDAAVATAFDEDDPDGRRRNTRAVVVVQDGRIVAERYADGFDESTPLLGWSMTKSVANAVVGRLVGADVLGLDERGVVADLIRQAAPDDADVIDQRMEAVTLDHLLHMSSGLAFDEVYDPGTDATRMLFTPSDTGAFAAARGMQAEPGTVWSYSSGTTNIICDVAQRASGGGVDLARDLVFEPLGMTSAVLESDVTGGLVCSSYLYATARDWARFGQWFLQDGEWDGQRLLPDGWVEYSTAPVELDTEDDKPYGAQWWLNDDGRGHVRMPGVPPDAYWASGHEGQHVVVIPSTGTVVVRLGLTSDFDGIEWGLERLLVGVLDAIDGSQRRGS